MIKFTDILNSCRRNLYERNHRGSGSIDLTRPSICNYLAFSDMYRNHHYWLGVHAPFFRFAERAANRVLRQLGDAINLNLVNGTEEIRVKNQYELEEALLAGYYYRPGKPHQINNPCAEIALENFALCNLTVPESRIHIGGSPFIKHLIHAQLRLVMRHIYRHLFPGLRSAPIIEGLPYVELNQKALRKIVASSAPPFVRELFYAFYNENRMPQWWHELRQLNYHLANADSTELYAQYVAKCLYDAMDKGEAFKREWKTSTVMAMIDGMHKNESFGDMPVLADALGDAGCDNQELLDHMRDPNAEFTLGSWLFRVCGRMK